MYYRQRADPEYWEKFWRKSLTPSLYAASEAGNLGWLHGIFPQYVTPGSRVLDAGCGPGTYVLALQKRGYRAEGVEWSEGVVRAVLQLKPDLPVRKGDATCLGSPDNEYDAYVSLGVMEHLRDGPDAFLREAYRVTRQGGVAFISVPYCHVLRRFKMRLGFYRGDPPEDLEFYQYAFDRNDFGRRLESAGFAILMQTSYGAVTGLRQELPVLDWLLRLPRLGARLERMLQLWKWGETHLGHAILFVCRKV